MGPNLVGGEGIVASSIPLVQERIDRKGIENVFQRLQRYRESITREKRSQSTVDSPRERGNRGKVGNYSI